MLILLALVLGILAGYACRGRLRRLATLKFHWVWLVVVAAIIQLLIFPLTGGEPLLRRATVPLHFFSYALAVLFVALNLRVRPLAVLATGAVLNLLPLVANEGYMPVSLDALRRCGAVDIAERLIAEGRFANVVTMSADTRLNLLGDRLSVPLSFPGSIAFSIGDVLIAVGLGVLVWWGMTRSV